MGPVRLGLDPSKSTPSKSIFSWSRPKTCPIIVQTPPSVSLGLFLFSVVQVLELLHQVTIVGLLSTVSPLFLFSMPSQDVTLSYTCWVFSILMYLHFLHWPNLFFICWCKTCVGEKPHQDFSRSTTNEPPWFINKVTIIKIIYPSVFSLSIYISAVPYIFYIHIYISSDIDTFYIYIFISSDIDIFCRYFHGRTQVPRHRIPGRIWPFCFA